MNLSHDFKKITQLIRPQWKSIGLSSLFMAITALSTASYAYLVGPVLKSLFSTTSPETPHGLTASPVTNTQLQALSVQLSQLSTGIICLLVVTCALIKGLSFFAGRALLIHAGQRILLDLRTLMYRGLITLNPLSKHATNIGKLVTRFTVDAQTVEQAVTNGFLAIVRDTLQILALCALAVFLDPLLGLVGLVAFPPIAFLILRIGKELRTRKKAVYKAFGNVGDTVDETTSGLKIIQAFGLQKFMEKRFAKHSTDLKQKIFKAALLKATSSPINELLGAMALGLTLIYAGHRINAGKISPESFISFFTALLLLYQPVKGLGKGYHLIQSGLAALDRMTFLTQPPKPNPTQRNIETTNNRAPQLTLQNIVAGYQKDRPILNRINLAIPPGSKVAIVGSSGAGKTTLLNLLCGYIKPSSGQILIDGQSINLAQTPIHTLIAPVLQEPFLFDDTIEMNIRCACPQATHAQLLAACKAADILSTVENLPQKLLTPVGRKGALLSVGQRQRICLARALLSNAPILILDEVTASLDGETENTLVNGIDEMLNEKTVIVITHRLATAKWANTIALLENGDIQEHGPSCELLKNSKKIEILFGKKHSLTQ